MTASGDSMPSPDVGVGRSRYSTPDSGFSLAEMLINVVILGFLSVGLAQVFAIVSRTLPQAEAQAEDARALIGLSIWLPEDLSSAPSALDDGTGPGGLNIDKATPSGCAGSSPGSNLLRARWTEVVGESTVQYVANYRYVEKGAGYTVVRHECVLGQPAISLGMTGVFVASTTCPPPPGERLVEVSLVADAKSAAGGAVFSVRAGCSLTQVRGLSNNPDDKLGEYVVPTSTTTTSTTTTTTVPPTTTTVAGETTTTTAGATTTTAATTTTVSPCTSATIVSVAPSQANNGANEDMSELNKDIVVTVSSTGYCPTLGIIFDPWNADGTPSTHSRWYSMEGRTTITLLGRGGELWSDGAHTISLKDSVGSPTVLATAVLTVQ